MRKLLCRHLLLFRGILSFALFFVVAILDQVGETGFAQTLAGPMRVLIVPVYLVWMLIAIAQVAVAGPHGLPPPFGMIVSAFSMVASLAPYALGDYILERIRRTRSLR